MTVEEQEKDRRSTDSRVKVVTIVASASLVAVGHFLTPAGPDGWHWFHILFQKLFYVPILLAAAWLGTRWTVATASGVTALFLVHIVRDWSGNPMLQADQIGEIASFWVIAFLSSILFRREREALEEARTAHEETLSVLASTLDLREHETALHSRRVREYTLLIARRMGLEEEAVLGEIGLGAIVHDVGKIGIPDRILLKRGNLNEEDWKEIRRHPELGALVIGQVRFLDGARQIVLAHHEKYDGSGYPRGLAGSEIPAGARIFAVADAFDALTNDRPYRLALPYGEAAEVIAGGRGTHFDPGAVDAFFEIPYREWEAVARRHGASLREGST